MLGSTVCCCSKPGRRRGTWRERLGGFKRVPQWRGSPTTSSGRRRPRRGRAEVPRVHSFAQFEAWKKAGDLGNLNRGFLLEVRRRRAPATGGGGPATAGGVTTRERERERKGKRTWTVSYHLMRLATRLRGKGSTGCNESGLGRWQCRRQVLTAAARTRVGEVRERRRTGERKEAL